MFDLSGKCALVTGASGGIGGAIARALHAQGATVALSGTREDALGAVAAKLGGERTRSPRHRNGGQKNGSTPCTLIRPAWPV